MPQPVLSVCAVTLRFQQQAHLTHPASTHSCCPAVGAILHSDFSASEFWCLQALYLARRAGFLRAEARVRHAEGLHSEALACLARDARCGRAERRAV